MAYYGLQKPLIAKYNRSTGVYSDGFVCGKGVSFEVTPNYAEGSLYADNEQAEYEKIFINADVTHGTSTLPIEAASTVFGHTVDTTTNNVTYKSSDEPNYVGTGVVIDEVVDGVKKYYAVIITCVKFQEGAESFTTKGDSITFATPSISGKAIPDKQSGWRIRQEFSTAAAAEAYIRTMFNMSSPASITPIGG